MAALRGYEERAQEALQRFRKFYDVESVADMQHILKKLGYYRGRVDNIYGPKTHEAFTTFWKVHSYDIASLQRKLGELGYPVRVDGIFGPETRGALKALFKANGWSYEGDVEAVERFLSLSSATPIKGRAEQEVERRRLLDYFFFVQGMPYTTGAVPFQSSYRKVSLKTAGKIAEKVFRRMGYAGSLEENLRAYLSRRVEMTRRQWELASFLKELMPLRANLFLREVLEVASLKNWDVEALLSYLRENRERAKALWEAASRIAGRRDEVLMHVVLSALVAEWAYGVDAAFLVAIALQETGGLTVYGRNGQGVMQITRNSSVSHLRGDALEWAEETVRRAGHARVGEPVSYALAHRGILWNVLAGAETVLLKLYELGRPPEALREQRFRRTVAERYNGHPRHMKAFGRNVAYIAKQLQEVVEA